MEKMYGNIYEVKWAGFSALVAIYVFFLQTSLGNFDGDTKTVQFLDDPIPLYDGQKTVRILLGNEDTGKCLRVELLACGKFVFVKNIKGHLTSSPSSTLINNS